MTAPTLPQSIAAGGQTITVGASPVLLTESAPITVINLSSDSTVWLGASANVAPGTAVPLAPSTSYTWQTPGILWCVADPSAAGPVSVVITGSSDSWSPSPVAIGAAVATELAAQGVPVTMQSDYLGLFDGSSGSVMISNLSRYSSVYVMVAASNPSQPAPFSPITYAWYERSIAEYIYGDTVGWNLPYQGGSWTSFLIPVLSDQLEIQAYSGAIPLNVIVVGLTRSFGQVPINTATAWSSIGFTATATVPAGSPAGTNTPLTVTRGQIFQGPARSYFLVSYASSSAITAFVLDIQIGAGGATDLMAITDSTQLSTYIASEAYVQYVNHAYPAADYIPIFHQSAATTAAINVTLQSIPYQGIG